MKKMKVKKTIQAFTICIAVILSLVAPTVKVYAAGGQCAEASCSGIYDNGFCSKCGGYEEPKVVSSSHYSQLNGTHAGYYAIENAGQLYWFSKAVNEGNVKIKGVLVSDIEVNEDVLDDSGILNSGKTDEFIEWTPIGTSKYFEGFFDGNNHSVSGLYCVSNIENIGLIGVALNATIKNVSVVDSYIKGINVDHSIGGIVAECVKSDVVNCYNYSMISAEGESAKLGGIVGHCIEANVTNCHNFGSVSSTCESAYIGGVNGFLARTNVTDCHNSGDVIVDMKEITGSCVFGGICGQAQGVNMTGCYNLGKLSVDGGDTTSQIEIGGIIGASYPVDEEDNIIKNCYNQGSLSVKTGRSNTIKMGGLISFSVYNNITNCYNTGDIIAEASSINGAYIGGLIGYHLDADIKNCFSSGALNLKGEIFETENEDISIGSIAGYICVTNISNTYYNSDKSVYDAIDEETANSVVDSVSGKTTEQFESGEVAYLLNGSRSEGTEENPLMWYQTTGADGVPTLDNTHKVVYYEDGEYGNYVPNINISYRTHVQTFGWEGNASDIKTWKSNGTMSGTSGKAKRLEGINIVVNSAEANADVDLGIQYTTHCQSYGWLPWSANGEMNGTEGEAKRLEAIKIQLTGEHADLYDVYYRVHAQSYGWLGWAKNGAPAGTAGYAKRLEGIQIVVVKKDESFNQKMEGITSARAEAFVAKAGESPIVNYAPTSNTNPVVPGTQNVNVAYRTHVQSYGWQAWKYNGQMSGTSGQAKRLEGINIELRNKDCSGDIVYTTHVQTYGWQGSETDQSKWFKNGQMAGTSGEAKRLEAICINLTGDMSKKYDIYYRVHAQSYGWLGWAKNGAPAGTAGYGKRLEGIQIVLVPKGGAAPGNHQGVVSTNASAYVEKK